MMVEERVLKPPVEARCRACGAWLSTVPAGTAWARGRCFNARVQFTGRKCELYGTAQTVVLPKT